MNTTLEKLTAKIQELVPDVSGHNYPPSFTRIARVFQLADILRAIPETKNVDIGGVWQSARHAVLIHWDLKLPLHLQKEEVIDFLLGLLMGE